MEKEKRETIKFIFDHMQTVEHFLALLNSIKKDLLKDKSHPFEMRQLNYYSNPKARKKCYHEFSIPKKNGTLRTITAPEKGLKMLQTVINVMLNAVVEPHEKAYGFVMGKSIVDNAKIHAGKNYVYNIDLKDFFPSVDQARVWTCLRLKPVNLVGDSSNERDRIANMISAICCKRMRVERLDPDTGEVVLVNKNVLPQGAPTSPILTNLVCQKLDFLLNRLAQNYKVKYSRYADDITFSSNQNKFEPEGDFVKRVNKIIEQQGFRINLCKVRLQSSGYRQEVTGLTVNERVNVPKNYTKELRRWLYLWERYGYVRAFEYYCEFMELKDKDPKTLDQVLRGKLNFLSMVKGDRDSTYVSLRRRYDRLKGGGEEESVLETDSDLGALLRDILDGDLLGAMQKYHG